METFLIYQLKVAVLAAALYLLYKWLLGRQTFHGFNRAALLLICALSFIIPVCHVENEQLNSEVRKVFPVFATADDANKETAIPIHSTGNGLSTDNGQSAISEPSAVADDPDADSIAPSGYREPVNWSRVAMIGLFVIWCIGFVWLLLRKTLSILSIRKLIREGRYQDRQDECDLIESDGISQPMNWMSFIMMPHDWIEKENQAVWNHELSHARKAHSLDLLVIDLMQLFQWFNPVMMLLYKEMELLHEFQADRAVIDSGTDARQYKLMLVNAVAENRGFAMTSWLRQTNLKKRIDMMQRNESNRWNRLRALFIPIVAAAFTVVNSSFASAQDQNFHWEPFQDGKTWVYENGMAKVRTVDGVEASMKTTEVADYLTNYKPVKTTRMTLRYVPTIEDLNDAYPLARSLADKGIHVSIANNDEMLTEMTMPEYRTPAIYDLGDGRFRFEVNCNQKRNVHLALITGSSKKYIKVVNPSVTGSLDEVMKWIDLFDGHGLAIYPKTMTTKEADKIAKAVWKRGLDQVSIVGDLQFDGEVYDGLPCKFNLTTIVPKGYSFEKEFGTIAAKDAVMKMHENHTSAYYDKGLRVEKPKFFAGDAWHEITDVINGPDELILITRIDQGSYQWVIGFSDCEIEAGGVRYKQTRSEGMEGFESTYFWSPTFAYYYQTIHFPPIPKDVKTINFYESNPTNTITKLQVVPDIDIFEGVRVVKYQQGPEYVLKTTHVGEDSGIRDVFSVERVDFTDTETTIYCSAYIRNAHSYPGHISSDYKLTLANGRVLEPIRYEGVPVDQNFDRHGDWVSTPYQVVFPAVSAEEWEEGAPVLTGSVLHEPVSVRLRDIANPYFHEVEFDRLEPGEYVAEMLVPKEKDDGLLIFIVEGLIQKFTVGSDGTITVRGDATGHLKDGKYSQETVTLEGEKQLKLIKGNKTMQFRVTAQSDYSEGNEDAVQIIMRHIPENAGADSTSESSGRSDWGMILMLVNENLK